MDQQLFFLILSIASLIGSIAFAFSGFLIGIRREFDIMGIFILSFLTANGGGVIRDLLLGQPVSILQSTQPFWITLAVMIIGFLLHWRQLDAIEKRWFFVMCDGIGLVAFGIMGAMVAIEQEVHFFGVITLSFLTATGGGMLRDTLTSHVPEVLHSGFYGSVAILVSISVYMLHVQQLLSPVSLLIVFVLALSLRLLAHKYRWRLPRFSS